MVSPKEDALTCQQCHMKEGRMKDVDGVYIPGRDSNVWLERIGIFAVLATLLGVLGHGLIRVVMSARRKH
mgnify:FL=1|jgi:hypothetical protein